MPNALAPEMGVVNYIHTMYSNRLKTESFFDEDLDLEKNPMERMFGKSYGHWPNSVRMNGSHVRAPCFHSRLDIYENSVYFGKQTQHADGFQRYVYPIKVTPHFNKFTGFDQVGSKLNGEYFWKHISAEVLQDLRERKAIVFLDWVNENFIENSEYKELHHGLKYSGIPKEQIILAVNSFNAQQVYESWFTPEERQLQVRSFPFLLCNMSWHYAANPDRRMTEQSFNASRDQIRKHCFVFPNRRARDHRVAMLHKLAADDLLDKGDWSFLDQMTVDHGTSVSRNLNIVLDQERTDKLYQQLPHSLETEPDSKYLTVSGWGDMHSKQSENSYLYIASETYVHGEYRSFTEKVFKPLANFQPFLFIAFPGALEQLKRLGFKTFAPFIDESYDRETDLSRRIHMIAAEVARICAMSKEELHNWYWSMEDTLIYNHRHLLEIYKNEPMTLGVIQELHQKVTSW
jgi:hypothetical protein